MAELRRTTDLVGDVRGKSGDDVERPEQPEIPCVRATDLEPYVGLRYLSKLFRLIAVILLLLLQQRQPLAYQGSVCGLLCAKPEFFAHQSHVMAD